MKIFADKRQTLVLGIFIIMALYLFASGIRNKVYAFFPDIIIHLVILIFFMVTSKKWNLNLTTFSLMAFGFLLHDMGTLGWYGASPVLVQWDHITHFFGSLPFGILFFRLFEPQMDYQKFTLKNTILLLTVFLAAFGVGAIVELSEFVGYLFLGTGNGAFMFGPGDGIPGTGSDNLIDLLGGGWINEGWDMTFNFVGVSLGIIIMLILRSGKPYLRNSF